MKKNLLVFVLCIISVGLWGQTIPLSKNLNKIGNIPSKKEQSKSGGQDTLYPQFMEGNLIVYQSPGGGYVGGTNGLNDMAHLERFDVYAPFSINKILYGIHLKSGSGAVTATIWADSNGVPGAPLRRMTLPLSNIDTSWFPLTDVEVTPPLSFTQPSGFWAGLEYFNRTSGDTVSLIMCMWPFQYSDCLIQRADSSYISLMDAYSIMEGYLIMPVIEYTPAYGSIQGSVFLDNNNNGILDVGETGIPNQLVKAGNYYATTDINGFYTIDVNTASQYTIQHMVQGYLISDSADIVVDINTFGIVLTGNNFPCHSIPGVRDLAVSLTPSNFRPGFQSYYWLSCDNEGTQIENGSVRITYDNQLTYINASPMPDTISGNTLSWNFSNLTPGEIRNIMLTMETPVSLPIGTLITSSAWIKPTTNDTLQSNNSYLLTHEISGSYDPNDKSVYPVGETGEGYIGLTPIPLEYTIRFQNSGTDTAFNIILKDTLDNDLDLSTLKFNSSSHPCEYLLSSDRLLTVTFANVLLPDSGTNQKASNGFFKFSVYPKNNLMQGTQITNYADIYFDFNTPVQTNTVINTMGVPLGVNENALKNSLLKIYPNPASGFIYVDNAVTKMTHYEIFNVIGEKVDAGRINGLDKIKIDVSNLGNGFYMLRIFNGKNSQMGGFSKIRE